MRANQKHRREARRKAAEIRAEGRKSLTVAEKVQIAQSRRGNSERELARLAH